MHFLHKYFRWVFLRPVLFTIFSFAMALPVTAQPPEPDAMSNPLAQVMVLIMVMLAVAIAILANVVNNATSIFREKLRKEKAAEKQGAAGMIVLLLMSSLALSLQGMAQAMPAAAPASADHSVNGISPLTFYVMVGVIAAEILILIALVYQLKFLVGIEGKKRVVRTTSEPAQPRESWWWRINKAVSREQEEAIDLSHDYDGISELDNKLPPWWTVAFAATILFSVIYLYRYHVSHSAPLSAQEFEIAMKKADEEKNAYLAKTASNVDENTVKMLDASGIASGQQLFTANCTPCHGKAGEGNTVGPNLTDDYWIHGGSLSSIFKTIKYGWVEKGMRSWKDDFSPVQIAQLTSYVKSIHGTNPPNGREPQGEVYKDSTTGGPDSTAVSARIP